MSQRFSHIPTHVITGFLGVGKTSLIQRFLQQKPEHERWAVLVNEFGDVGIDGTLLKTDSIAVSEVPGGCMCCSVGLPSRTALNQLIREQQPDRIIIEPTGLANPRQILAMFSDANYRDVLDVRAVICLVDPWCFTEPRFINLPDFHAQLQAADIVAATKLDLATPEQLQAFYDYCTQQLPLVSEVSALGAKLPWEWLALPRKASLAEPAGGVHTHAQTLDDQAQAPTSLPMGEDGSVKRENSAEFGFSCGWIFNRQWTFSHDALTVFLDTLPVPRVKGVLHTEQGWISVNRMRQTLSVVAIDGEPEDSRLEMISMDPMDWVMVDRSLKACRQ